MLMSMVHAPVMALAMLPTGLGALSGNLATVKRVGCLT